MNINYTWSVLMSMYRLEKSYLLFLVSILSNRLKIKTHLFFFVAIGFNVETVTYKNIKFQVWDLGGQTSIR